ARGKVFLLRALSGRHGRLCGRDGAYSRAPDSEPVEGSRGETSSRVVKGDAPGNTRGQRNSERFPSGPQIPEHQGRRREIMQMLPSRGEPGAVVAEDHTTRTVGTGEGEKFFSGGGVPDFDLSLIRPHIELSGGSHSRPVRTQSNVPDAVAA